ncbi:DUF397 domain-containing protein [Streptomyces sp. PKU-EA00015]|uniref:DUF397 domain-containing protein n=1 Tax=Streptomyces sp. PKU-EA00015 TaxID=2748326 RepID=UPI0015A04750|nr:DUF397 domain-containing protein [Streptomyces sp. PKU-EA00015]NWF25165.1 DUF397 domain-containing protein [Streptomyces sp. PKU-EA00015]
MSELKWFKSSFSEASGNACVEVAVSDTDTDIAIRDSVFPHHTFTVDRRAFAAFVASAGRSDRPARSGA